MAFDLQSITNEKRIRAPRIILLGVEKIGKSTFASGADRPVLIPIVREEGVDDLDVPKFPACYNFNDVIECFETLYKEDNNFGTVVIDSSSALEPIIWADVCEKNNNVDSIEKVMGGYGKGYGEALKNWGIITDALDCLRNLKNMASIIVGHVKVKRFDSPEGASYDQWQWDINDKAANFLYRWADAIFFANTKVIVEKEDIGFKKEHKTGRDIYSGARFLFTQKRPSHPGGGRGIYGRLPYELPLSFSAFMDAVSNVINSQQREV